MYLLLKVLFLVLLAYASANKLRGKLRIDAQSNGGRPSLTPSHENDDNALNFRGKGDLHDERETAGRDLLYVGDASPEGAVASKEEEEEAGDEDEVGEEEGGICYFPLEVGVEDAVEGVEEDGVEDAVEEEEAVEVEADEVHEE
eukprot:CAMPEP_0171352570 /NCGR_PEP_ID=MMETSP0878-20121228/41965_1 /TAXON_ID=67004 /ORGANISM="Thalassiosira weissflogii, Strain CCMP1336" /LENGTH=143 /DNA_ID=CAMNT_0011858257 /DNA_START=590 /DNA_END=1022 /DNA_ORIENTATION=+